MSTLAALTRVVDRGRYADGPEVPALEEEFAAWMRVPRDLIVAVSSGTAALTALMIADGVRGSVIVPAATFHATGLAALRAGAGIQLADVDDTWSLDPSWVTLIAEMPGSDAEAVIGVDNHGHPADWERLREASRGIFVYEDACPAYGSTYRSSRGRRLRAGMLARDGAAFSLNESKALSAGEGGIVLARDAEQAERIRSLRSFGEEPGTRRRRAYHWGADNWKMPELSAALARANLETLDERVEMARNAGRVLIEAAREHPALEPPAENEGADTAWHKVRIRVKDGYAFEPTLREAERALPVRGGEVDPLSWHPAFGRFEECPIAERLPWTFCLGSREEPLHSMPGERAAAYAEVITSLPVTQLEGVR